MEGADPGPTPLTAPTADASELPDWALVEPPEDDEQPEWHVAADPAPVAEPVAVDEPVAAASPVDVEPESAAALDEGHPSLALPIALALVLVMLLGAVGWLAMDARDTRARDDARQAALQAARQEAVNLTTISYETADADLARIIAAATGTLKTQFEAQRAQFPDVLKQDKSVSVGTVLAAGVASQSTKTVEALVAVDAAVSNAETAKAAGHALVKHYRMDMKLVLVDSHWLVSQVAFAGLPQ